MTIHNFLEAELKDEIIHEGVGFCRHKEIFSDKEIDSPVKFINYTVIPPMASFGMHEHGNDNEFYVILEGEGIYQQGDEKVRVKKGDIIMNSPYTAHGIVNTGEVDMPVLVFEVAISE